MGRGASIPASDFGLYLITDRRQTGGRPLYDVVDEALKGGLKALQLREKDLPVRELLELALKMRELTLKYGAMLFVNHHVDVALSVDADGVHIGHESVPVHAVREAAGPRLMIGYSAHSADEAVWAERAGADFATFGPVYPTPSKMIYGPPVGLEALGKAARKTAIPLYALGGIKLENASDALRAGAAGVSLISAVMSAADVRGTVEKFMEMTR